MTDNGTLIGRTTRPVLFTDKASPGGRSVRKPAGTIVYVTSPRPGIFRVRVPASLLEQDVYLSTVEPA
jgi:hypothetical protein